MKTTSHKVYFSDSRIMNEVKDESVALVVTSPPYPMIAMWDKLWDKRDFYEIHRKLSAVWTEMYYKLIPGGIACINIGDAVRTIDGNFQMFNNAALITHHCMSFGFQHLPGIIWRKQANTPNKFMGSGMLPSGAYVTLEHEHILIFRKGKKREFKTEAEKELRRESAYFWEERNLWFSDLWTDIKGAPQKLDKDAPREVSAAFPFAIPYRLINMLSIKDDIVLDPFLGTGTTIQAAMTSKRNSIGYEIDVSFEKIIQDGIDAIHPDVLNLVMQKRLSRHNAFVIERQGRGKQFKHHNLLHDMPCVSSQETALKFDMLSEIRKGEDDSWIVDYSQS